MTIASSADQYQSEDERQRQLIVGRRRQAIREAITAYLFVLPAALATFAFGIWPVIAGSYESVKSGSPLTNRYVGLANYLRALGSLTYIILFTLCLVFIYASYTAWRRMRNRQQELGGNPIYYLLPGLVTGMALIILAFNFVTGSEAYDWLPAVMFFLAAGGFFTAEWFQDDPAERSTTRLWRVWGIVFVLMLFWVLGPVVIDELSLGTIGWIVLIAIIVGLFYVAWPHLRRVHTWQLINSSTVMALLMLLAILLGRYTVAQMASSTSEAREVSQMIFNPEVANAIIRVPADEVVLEGLTLAEEIIAEVEVGGETIQAPLAPEAYDEMSADRLSYLRVALSNNARVQVVLPDGSTTEGILTGLRMGEQLEIGLDAEDLEVQREVPVYSVLDVGPEVINNNGQTASVENQFLAALVIFLGIGTIYLITWVRRRLDSEENFAAYRRLYWLRILLAVVVAIALFYMVASIQLNRIVSSALQSLSEDEFRRAYEYVTGSRPHPSLRAEVLAARLMYWPQVFLVTVGALLIGAAYMLWQSAQSRESKLGFAGTIFLATALMVGGWMLISELPQTIDLAGREASDTLDALTRTALYSIGTVPIQLALGLFLAYLLFSEIGWGKSLYRVIYFMPYIAPTVATSTVFLVIFRPTEKSLANQFFALLGMDPLLWLKEPNGVIRIFYEQVLGGNPLNIPEMLQGPSLALFTVILYNIWVFAGYNAVIFLAGLGAIPGELYEAAEVDGAGRWSRFRNITLPLLSPTTFFLSMLSIIGTFKAFSHIYVLRGQATGKEVDTMSVHIFNQLYSANDPGYAAALAFILFAVILVLTLAQNRLSSKQVFYG